MGTLPVSRGNGECPHFCLDALDVFTRFPGVKLIGAPSSADTTYMETRSQMLPSGIAGVVVPLKTWMHRPRASGQVYTPNIALNELEWSTDAFLKRIEQDLER